MKSTVSPADTVTKRMLGGSNRTKPPRLAAGLREDALAVHEHLDLTAEVVGGAFGDGKLGVFKFTVKELYSLSN